MADEKKALEFDRRKHGLRATRTFSRSGVSVLVEGEDAKSGKALTDRQVSRLSGDDIEALHAQGVVEVTDGRGAVKADQVVAPPVAGLGSDTAPKP